VSRFLLDTVVLSATRRPDRNPEIERWFELHRHGDFFVSVLTLGELQQGIELAPDARSRAVLQRWFLRLRAFYDDHLIPFGADEALAWGSLYAPLQLAGRPPALVDSMIAATALVHGLPIVTRNGSDFAPLGVEVINPWMR